MFTDASDDAVVTSGAIVEETFPPTPVVTLPINAELSVDEGIGELDAADVDTFTLGGDVVVTTEDEAKEEEEVIDVVVLVVVVVEEAKIEEVVGGFGVVVVVVVVVAFVVDEAVEMGCFVVVDGETVDGGTLGSKTHSSGVVAMDCCVAANKFNFGLLINKQIIFNEIMVNCKVYDP